MDFHHSLLQSFHHGEHGEHGASKRIGTTDGHACTRMGDDDERNFGFIPVVLLRVLRDLRGEFFFAYRAYRSRATCRMRRDIWSISSKLPFLNSDCTYLAISSFCRRTLSSP